MERVEVNALEEESIAANTSKQPTPKSSNEGDVHQSLLVTLSRNARDRLLKKKNTELGQMDNRNALYEEAQLQELKSSLANGEEARNIEVDVLQVKENRMTFLGSRLNLSSEFYLVISPKHYTAYHERCGPFKAVRIVILPNGEYEVQVMLAPVTSGTLSRDKSTRIQELIMLVHSNFSEDHVLCPGLVGYEDIEKRLGYLPSQIQIFNWPWLRVHHADCKGWYVPSRQLKTAAAAAFGSGEHGTPSPGLPCASCRPMIRYIEERLKSHNLTDEQRAKRQTPGSHCPYKYLSPNRRKYYKQTKVKIYLHSCYYILNVAIAIRSLGVVQGVVIVSSDATLYVNWNMFWF